QPLGPFLRIHQREWIVAVDVREIDRDECAVTVAHAKDRHLHPNFQQPPGNPEWFEYFERMRVYHAGARSLRGLAVPVDELRRYTQPFELGGQGQTHWPCANDEDFCFSDCVFHGDSP